MRYTKFFALAVALTSLVACSDDKKEVNSAGDVMVEMADAQITVKETAGIFNVPVKVTGNPNGIVTVTVQVAESGNNGAKEASIVDGKRVGNYIITSKTINIPSDEKTANIQINTIDDDLENDDRSFTITIEKAEGAKIDESKKTTIVTLKDNDKNPYDKLEGEWVFGWDDIYEGARVEFPVTITGYDEGTLNYNKVLLMNDLLTNPPYIKPGESQLKLNYFYDEATDVCHIEIAFDQRFGSLNGDAMPGYGGLGVYFEGAEVVNGQLNLIEGYLEGTVSADYKSIQFSPEDMIAIYVENAGLLFAGDNVTFTKK